MSEDGYVALGKYSNAQEDALHFMCTSGWGNGEFGNVEAPTGYVWKISNDWEEVKPENGEFNSLMEEWFELNGTFKDSPEFRRSLVGHFIVNEDSNGIVFLMTAETAKTRDEIFENLEAKFNEWDSQDDED